MMVLSIGQRTNGDKTMTTTTTTKITWVRTDEIIERHGDMICLTCRKSCAAHAVWTPEDVAATAGATYESPKGGRLAPVSERCIGRWKDHIPHLKGVRVDAITDQWAAIEN